MPSLRLGLVLLLLYAPAVPAGDLRETVEAHVAANQKAILTDLWQALSFPGVAADRSNIRRKAGYLRVLFEERGFDAELLETDGNPLVYARLDVPGASRTLLFYLHYDGQPVEPSEWAQDDPFQPVLRDGKLADDSEEIEFAEVDEFDPDWRIYARSASDDTGPIVALLAAFDALRSAGVDPGSNIRVILDGEEEAGSPNLVPAIERYRDKLRADMMLILDGPLHQSGRPTVVFGARGIMTIDLTVYGPAFPLHSGHYGNWAPNPAMQLAELLASMKDRDGRVTIEGYYDGVNLTPEDRAVLAGVPDELESLQSALGFSRPDEVGDSLQEAIQYPSLNVRGLQSASTGDAARTVIPATATAALDLRLVRETPPDDIYAKLLAHIRQQGFHIVSGDPDDAERARHGRIVKVTRGPSMSAYRTDLSNELAREIVAAIGRVRGEPPVLKRTSGGTVPIAPFIEALRMPALGVPTVNYDNNQHSPNENLRLGHFFDSVATFAAILAM